MPKISLSLIHTVIALCALGIFVQGVAAQERSDRWQAGIPVRAFELNEQGTELAKQAKYNEAVAAFEQAIAIKPDYYLATLNLALALDFRSWKGDDQRAEEQFRKALQIAEKTNSRDIALYNTFGWFLHLRNRLPEAKQYYLKALELDPNNSRVLNNLGSVHQWMGDLKTAKMYYERAVKAGSTKARENLSRLKAS